MKLFYFRVSITYKAFEKIYHVPSSVVKVNCENGQSLQLPAQHFKPFLSQLGVRGRFELTLGESHQFIKMQQVAN